MTRQEILANARRSLKPKRMFENEDYSLSIIPMNYRILIKLSRKQGFRTIDRDFYTPLEYGIKYAHKIAKEMIGLYFTGGIQSKFEL